MLRLVPFTIKPGRLPRPMQRISPWAHTPRVPSHTARTPLMRRLAFGGVTSPAAGAVETRWWAGEGASSTGEARGGPTACRTGGMMGTGPVVCRVVVASSHDVAVVAGALLGVREDAVGFAYAHKALGCVGIAGVMVRVVGFGEGVERSGRKGYGQL